jgi:predicted transport protein
MPRSPAEMMQAVSASMQERTGRTVEEWVALVESSDVDPVDQNAVRRWLKSEHALPQNSRYAVAYAAAEASGWVPPTTQDHIDDQYSGAKAELRPVFDRVRSVLEDLGDDVSMEGRKTYVPFVRRRQFAAVAAATRSRVDVGLRFVEPPDSSLLIEASAPGQATHKLSLTTVGDVTDDVVDLLRAAYQQNG